METRYKINRIYLTNEEQEIIKEPVVQYDLKQKNCSFY